MTAAGQRSGGVLAALTTIHTDLLEPRMSSSRAFKGMLTELELRSLVDSGEIATPMLAVSPGPLRAPGRQAGRRPLLRDEVLAHGMHACDYLARLRHGDGSDAGLPLRLLG
jgi:hypothetical protein